MTADNEKNLPTQNDKTKKGRMVHASFRKVVAFDLLFLGFGILIGIGIGVYLIAK